MSSPKDPLPRSVQARDIYNQLRKASTEDHPNILFLPPGEIIGDKIYFLVAGLAGRLRGGEYLYELKITKKFPHEPPAIRSLTPNGIFSPGQNICISIGVFHKNQQAGSEGSWGYRSVLGLSGFARETVNFMQDAATLPPEDMPRGIGIKVEHESMQRLAQESREYNLKHRAGLYREVQALYRGELWFEEGWLRAVRKRSPGRKLPATVPMPVAVQLGQARRAAAAARCMLGRGSWCRYWYEWVFLSAAVGPSAQQAAEAQFSAMVLEEEPAPARARAKTAKARDLLDWLRAGADDTREASGAEETGDELPCEKAADFAWAAERLAFCLKKAGDPPQQNPYPRLDFGRAAVTEAAWAHRTESPPGETREAMLGRILRQALMPLAAGGESAGFAEALEAAASKALEPPEAGTDSKPPASGAQRALADALFLLLRLAGSVEIEPVLGAASALLRRATGLDSAGRCCASLSASGGTLGGILAACLAHVPPEKLLEPVLAMPKLEVWKESKQPLDDPEDGRPILSRCVELFLDPMESRKEAERLSALLLASFPGE